MEVDAPKHLLAETTTKADVLAAPPIKPDEEALIGEDSAELNGDSKKRKKHDNETAEERAERKRRKKEKKEKKEKKKAKKEAESSDED